jgi:hypothetical protein
MTRYCKEINLLICASNYNDNHLGTIYNKHFNLKWIF